MGPCKSLQSCSIDRHGSRLANRTIGLEPALLFDATSAKRRADDPVWVVVLGRLRVLGRQIRPCATEPTQYTELTQDTQLTRYPVGKGSFSRFGRVNGRGYVEVARMSFRRQSTYRGAMVAGTFTNFVWGFLLASVLRSVIGAGSVGGLTRTTATSFTFLAQGLIATSRMFGDMTLVAAVRSGDVATELQRPWDWSTYRLSSDLGQSLFSTLTRGSSIVVAGWIVYRLPLPTLSNGLAFAGCTVLAAVLASRLWTMAGLASFWLVDGTGVVQMVVGAATFGAGLMVPLQIYGASVRSVLYLLPFAGLVQGPIDVFLGLRGVGLVIAHQVIWIAVLEALLRFELGAATRKLEVQGG
jgi:ABC-2 type transport system permease protein